ncbi:MAG: Calx-beta domain-containing protein [Pseudomonadota bacterium]
MQFSKAKYKVGEGDGTITISVTRTGNNGAISVDYATSDNTAIAGSDYTQTSGTLNWNDGDDADKTFTINITDDSAQEGNERLVVSLGNPTGGAQLGSPDTAEVTIIDNDSAFSCKKVSEIPKNECKALVALYDSTKGENWENNSGWNVTNSPCSWNGVSCQGGHVTELSLGNNNLKGSISKNFFKLKQLKKLDLSDNEIDRSILKYVNKFNKLNSLLLNNCLK